MSDLVFMKLGGSLITDKRRFEAARPVVITRLGKEIAEALTGFTAEPQQLKLPSAPQSPIILHDAADRPQPLLDVNAGGPGRAAGMAVSVGRLRQQGRRFGFFLLVHNTMRGAAGGSVLNAELAVRSGLIPGGEA